MSPLTASITTTKERSEIQLYLSEKKKEFASFPIILTSKDHETFKYLESIIDIANQQIASPLTRAKIPWKDACQTLKNIENSWETALVDYQDNLENAVNKDLETIELSPNLAKNTGCTYSIPGILIAGGAFVTGAGTIVVLAGSACAVGGYMHGDLVEKTKNNVLVTTAMTHRKAMLLQIDAWEKKRERETYLLINEICKALTKHLHKEMKDGEFSSSKLKELKQLQKFTSANFPAMPLQTKEGKVCDFIKKIEADL